MNDLKIIFDNLLNSNNIDKCKFFICHVIRMDNLLIDKYRHYKCENLASTKELLKKLAREIPANREDEVLFIYDYIDGNIIENTDFMWLENDNAACSFFWCYLIIEQSYLLRERRLESEDFRDDNYIDGLINTDWVKVLKLVDSNSSHEERFISIKYFFNIAFLNIDKHEIMSKIRSHWKLAYEEIKDLKWLPDDYKSLEWTWDYLNKYTSNQRKSRRHVSIFEFLPVRNFNPTNEKEYRLAILTALRIWQPEFHAEKRLLLQDMSKAWRQRKFRAERENKKSLNCYLDVSVKNHLDELAKAYDKTIVDMVTYLIESEYRNSK
ncbi:MULTISPECIES: hypothetical protein [unclassified Providencia]|uniref:hypothetical protein n=1 Tax=unclassified Providencia TaxID=2633465 RepID=UPI00234B47B9|nr:MULTISPECIES: hypothetical protein [unclassified Providencia]